MTLGPGLPDAESVMGKPFWLNLDPEPVYAVLHTPVAGRRSRVAVLILPTFGWENDCSYRARRDWAAAFAAAGATAVRFDFPGTEDSVGSPLRPGRFQTWVGATVEVVRWVRRESGCDRLVLVGVGFGGIVGYESVVAGAPVDELVLWAVRASGRAYIREQRTFAAVATGVQSDKADAERPDGMIGLAGHRVSPETIAAISAVDLTASVLPSRLQRVLLIGRDASGVDARLRDHIKESGAELSVIDVDDYRLLVMNADMGETPIATIEQSVAWCVDDAGRQGEEPTLPVQSAQQFDPSGARQQACTADAVTEVEFEFEGIQIRERLLEVESRTGRLFAVLAEPVGRTRHPFCLTSVNTARLRHTGPSRMMVELTRRAAAAGVAAVRLDLPGLGDSDGDTPRVYERYEHDNMEAVAALRALYDRLETSAVADRFVPAGLCLGGYVAAVTTAVDRRSIGMVGLNPQLAWGAPDRHLQRRLASKLAVVGAPGADVSLRHIPGVLRPLTALVTRLTKLAEDALEPRLMSSNWARRVYWFSSTRNACRLLRRLGQSGARVLLVSAVSETIAREIAAGGLAEKVLEGLPNVVFAPIDTRSHLFEPLWSQDELFGLIGSYLDDVRAATVQIVQKEDHKMRAFDRAGIRQVRGEEL